MDPMPKSYDPAAVEAALYEAWLAADFFAPDGAGSRADPTLPPFVIVQPPPNVTGALHLGHALTATVEDALVRRARESAGDPARLGNVLKYAKNFPQREMGVMLVTDLHRAVGQPLFQVPEFTAWANSVAELMLYDFKPSA